MIESSLLIFIIISLILITLFLIIRERKLHKQVLDINAKLDLFIDSENFDENFKMYLKNLHSKEQNVDNKIDHLIKQYDKNLLEDFIDSEINIDHYLEEKQMDFDKAIDEYNEKMVDQYLEDEKRIDELIEQHDEKRIDEYNEKMVDQYLEDEKRIDEYFDKKANAYSTDIPSKPVKQDYKVESTVFNEISSKWNIECLYHMTHIVNIRSIFDHNLLSHNLAHKGNYIQVDISMSTVNQRRNRSEPIFNKNLHDYVPLYFNIKNPMLYVRRSMAVNLVILKINKNVLNKKKVLFSDGNAASSGTNFYSQLAQLDKLDWECLMARFWHHYNDGKRTKCSEVLVPDMIEVSQIEGIICNNTTTLKELKTLLPTNIHDKIILNAEYYF